MHADSHFVIGAEHHRKVIPCQDHADGASLPGGAAFATVSDGCSTGGDTDKGARVQTASTAQALRQHWGSARTTDNSVVDKIAMQQRLTAATAAATLGYRHNDMLATSLYAFLSPDGGFAHIQGDGVVAWKYSDGRVGATRYEWNRNAPFYPAYVDDNYREFTAFHGGNVNAVALTAETWEQPTPGAELELVRIDEYTISQGIQGPVRVLPSGLRFVAVLTDGATQIDGLDWKQAIVMLMDFGAAVKGSFAKRQMSWFVQEVMKRGNGPVDDLAFAVIDCEGEEGTR